jgi:hypothetical protein
MNSSGKRIKARPVPIRLMLSRFDGSEGVVDVISYLLSPDKGNIRRDHSSLGFNRR